ncbi:hypothetical protein PROFUN_07495 [Planoprotostelium fungivorum]|uniref:Uncharacterized protein n=1 Tax=Planoprotostelium fungivorum TaxID=1890364 RepID=A0A2P6NLK6_9EUKA|nr:hypothetical protein PROFUN_07495 [Planoprotostelium fungivorum]
MGRPCTKQHRHAIERQTCTSWHDTGDIRRDPRRLVDGVRLCEPPWEYTNYQNQVEQLYSPMSYKASLCQKMERTGECHFGRFCSHRHVIKGVDYDAAFRAPPRRPTVISEEVYRFIVMEYKVEKCTMANHPPPDMREPWFNCPQWHKDVDRREKPQVVATTGRWMPCDEWDNEVTRFCHPDNLFKNPCGYGKSCTSPYCRYHHSEGEKQIIQQYYRNLLAVMNKKPDQIVQIDVSKFLKKEKATAPSGAAKPGTTFPGKTAAPPVPAPAKSTLPSIPLSAVHPPAKPILSIQEPAAPVSKKQARQTGKQPTQQATQVSPPAQSTTPATQTAAPQSAVQQPAQMSQTKRLQPTKSASNLSTSEDSNVVPPASHQDLFTLLSDPDSDMLSGVDSDADDSPSLDEPTRADVDYRDYYQRMMAEMSRGETASEDLFSALMGGNEAVYNAPRDVGRFQEYSQVQNGHGLLDQLNGTSGGHVTSVGFTSGPYASYQAAKDNVVTVDPLSQLLNETSQQRGRKLMRPEEQVLSSSLDGIQYESGLQINDTHYLIHLTRHIDHGHKSQRITRTFMGVDSLHSRQIDPVCIKIFPNHFNDENIKRAFETESTLLKTFDHVNIIKWRSAGIPDERTAHQMGIAIDSKYLITEYCGDSIYTVVESLRSHYKPYAPLLYYVDRNKLMIRPVVIEICSHILHGLAFIHSRSTLHGEVAPHHVVMDVRTLTDINGISKVKWSGLHAASLVVEARQVNKNKSKGFNYWLPPEMMSHAGRRLHSYSVAAEVFSVGCVLYFLLTSGRHPYLYVDRTFNNAIKRTYPSFFDDLSEDIDSIISHNVIALQRSGQNFLDLKPIEHLQEAHDLLYTMLGEEETRPGLLDCLNHPFFWSQHEKIEFVRRYDTVVNGNDPKMKKTTEKIAKKSWCPSNDYHATDKWSMLIRRCLESKVRVMGYSYDFSSLCSLISLIRNTLEHMNKSSSRDPTFSQDLREILGKCTAEALAQVVFDQFPLLVVSLYRILPEMCNESFSHQDGLDELRNFVEMRRKRIDLSLH